MMSVSRSRWLGIDSWAGQPLYSLAPAIEEGMALCAVMENGFSCATILSSPGSSDIFLGFAYNYYTRPTQLIAVETFTVPASPGPYTITLSNTPLNPTTGVLVKDASNNVFPYDSTPDGTDYNISGTTLTFNAADAGKVVTVTYAYSPSAAQIQYAFGDAFANASASAVTGTIGLIRRGLIYTTNFDPVQDYLTNPTLRVQANGMVGVGGSGPLVNGYVYEVPSADNPYLGINFSAA